MFVAIESKCSMSLDGLVLTWLFYHLAKEQALQDRLRAEILAQVPNNESISVEALAKCSYVIVIVLCANDDLSKTSSTP